MNLEPQQALCIPYASASRLFRPLHEQRPRGWSAPDWLLAAPASTSAGAHSAVSAYAVSGTSYRTDIKSWKGLASQPWTQVHPLSQLRSISSSG